MNLTKKRIEACKELVKQYGYWSEQVRDYIGAFPYHIAQRLHDKMIQFEKKGYRE